MKTQLLVLSCLLLCLHSQVLGIDLGTEFLKAALISPGKSFVVVQNTRSQRKTPNAISFIDGIRLFEDQALSKKIRYPQYTYTDLNILLPLLDNPELKVDYPHSYKIREYDNNRTIVFEIEGKQVWLEQLYGMILKNIKTLASKQAGTEIKDTVLTVPGDWGLGARNAILNAAHIGGLSVLSILRANTAAALNYAMSRNDNEPINVMFVNAGSYSLEISIAQFWGYDDNKTKTIESVKVLAYSTASNVSGYIVDETVATILANKFQSKHKVDLRNHKRAWDTLVSKSSDVKEVLSANRQSSVYIEGIHQGIDLHLQVTRKQLQEASSFQHLLPIIQSTLAEAGLKKQQIASVEMIGGVSRIPKLVSIVSNYFNPIEVGTHINGDECMALGAVLHAANMSITFKVKKIHLYDGWPFSLSSTVKGSGDENLFDEEIFVKGAPNTEKKEVVVNFGEEESLVVKINREGEQLKQFNIESLQRWKGTFKRENLTKEPELVLTFTSSSSEIVGLKGYVAVYVNETKVKQITDYVKELLEEQKEAEEEQKESEIDKQPQQEQPAQQQPKTDQQNKDETPKQQQTSEQKSQKKKRFKTVSVKKNLTYTEQKLTKFNVEITADQSKYRRFSPNDITGFHQQVSRGYEQKEKSVKERAEIKNELESKLYFLKSSFDQEYMKVFSKPEELEALQKVVEEKLEWLDENSYSGSTYDFRKQFNSLIRAANPIFNRSSQYQSRGKAVNETFEYIGVAYQKTVELNTTNPWLGEKIDELLLKINVTAQGIIDKLEEIKKQPLNEDPIIYNADLFRRAEKLREEYYTLSIIPKPKREKKPKIVIETEEKKPEEATENAKQENGETKENPQEGQL